MKKITRFLMSAFLILGLGLTGCVHPHNINRQARIEHSDIGFPDVQPNQLLPFYGEPGTKSGAPAHVNPHAYDNRQFVACSISYGEPRPLSADGGFRIMDITKIMGYFSRESSAGEWRFIPINRNMEGVDMMPILKDGTPQKNERVEIYRNPDWTYGYWHIDLTTKTVFERPATAREQNLLAVMLKEHSEKCDAEFAKHRANTPRLKDETK